MKGLSMLRKENKDIKLTLCISLYLLLSVLISFKLCGQPAKYNRVVDKTTLIYLLQNKAFAHLNTKLEEFWKEYEEDYSNEDNVYDAFSSFARVVPSFQNLLDEWVKQYTDSWVPYVARARYYYASAWQLIDKKWIVEREGWVYSEAERFLTLALSDIEEALKRNSRLDICYAMQIEIGMVTGKKEMIEKALASALKIHTYSYRIRLQYLESLAPRWGGNYQEMQAYIDSSKKFYEGNPRIAELSSAIPADKGKYFIYLGKYEHAVKMFTEALKCSNFVEYYINRGDAYYGMRNFKMAQADYNEALKLSPNDPACVERLKRVNAGLEQLSYLQGKSNPLQDKLDDFEMDEKSLVTTRQEAIECSKRALDHFKAGRYEQAIDEYSKAIKLAPAEYSLYIYRAWCYRQTGNDDGALQDYLRAIELKPNEIRSYISAIEIFFNKGIYDQALELVDKVISVDPSHGEAFFYRSKINERKGNHVEAVEDMRKACDLGYDRACRTYKQIMKF